MEDKKIILIAGATGFIGKKLIDKLSNSAEVRILTRQKEKLNSAYYYWEPYKNEIDLAVFEGVTHIVNLCGAGIADKRWTKSRKKELEDSRIIPTQFLYSKKEFFPQLKQYISASGINCYDSKDNNKIFTENDNLANDFVSQLVQKWENSAAIFSEICPVLKLRISFVISDQGGALKKLEQPIKMGFGAVIGSGKQAIPWIHLDDLVSLFEFGIENKLEGIYHANASNTTNEDITLALAKKLKKKIWLPKIPAFAMKIILGELSFLVLEGIQASNKKILDEGFDFKYKTLETCLSSKSL
jgi:uncharacterized protein (TIGR01777 family)